LRRESNALTITPPGNKREMNKKEFKMASQATNIIEKSAALRRQRIRCLVLVIFLLLRLLCHKAEETTKYIRK